MINKIINILKSFFYKKITNINNRIKKDLIYKMVLNDFYFWEQINLPNYTQNRKNYNNGICPYCGKSVGAKKNRAFKCPNCKNKIIKRSTPIERNYIYCTETEANDIDNNYSEIAKRKKFLEIYKNIDDIKLTTPEFIEIGNQCKTQYTNDKKRNLQILIQNLHIGIPKYYKSPKYINKIRMLRFYEGEIQTAFGSIQQATNAYMTILYIDLIGDYNELYSKELKSSGEEEWFESFIAPGIFSRAFCENLSIEKYEKIFKFNANCFFKEVNYKLPITPDEAWVKIIDYKNNNDD